MQCLHWVHAKSEIELVSSDCMVAEVRGLSLRINPALSYRGILVDKELLSMGKCGHVNV